VTIGQPHPIASSKGRPNPSHNDGKRKIQARVYRSRSVSRSTCGTTTTRRRTSARASSALISKSTRVNRRTSTSRKGSSTPNAARNASTARRWFLYGEACPTISTNGAPGGTIAAVRRSASSRGTARKNGSAPCRVTRIASRRSGAIAAIASRDASDTVRIHADPRSASPMPIR